MQGATATYRSDEFGRRHERLLMISRGQSVEKHKAHEAMWRATIGFRHSTTAREVGSY
jgi:hypothetical protein